MGGNGKSLGMRDASYDDLRDVKCGCGRWCIGECDWMNALPALLVAEAFANIDIPSPYTSHTFTSRLLAFSALSRRGSVLLDWLKGPSDYAMTAVWPLSPKMPCFSPTLHRPPTWSSPNRPGHRRVISPKQCLPANMSLIKLLSYQETWACYWSNYPVYGHGCRYSFPYETSMPASLAIHWKSSITT